MTSKNFVNSKESLEALARRILELAKKLGATSAEANVSESFGSNINVRKGAIETLEFNRDKGFSVTVYKNTKIGNASSSDFRDDSINKTVQAAFEIAKYTSQDEFAGLADTDQLEKKIIDLDLYHSWDYDINETIELAKECESSALNFDKKIKNTEGANVSTNHSTFVYGNTNGFLKGYPSSIHSLGCGVIAEDKGEMQRDYWWSTSRLRGGLEKSIDVGELAGLRAVKRLKSRTINTKKVPVIFDATISPGLIRNFLSAISGTAQYRKQTFLHESIGKKVFPDFINIIDDPSIQKGLASSPFDDEGVTTQKREIVSKGILNGYILSSYSARKLGLKSTGNAGGNHNILVNSTCSNINSLMKNLKEGFLVTELLGHGTNMVNGDFSRGAAGFWIENGEIKFPINEMTIAGNLKDMFNSILGISDDKVVRGSIQVGSILIENMTMGGK